MTRESNSSINKHSPDEQLVKLKLIQKKLLEAEENGSIIYQIDESIFDARQRANFSWSPLRKHIEIPKTPSKFNKRVTCMGAINSKTNSFVFQLKSGYFNTDDTIHMVKKLLSRHSSKPVSVFFDNCSIHVSKKAIAWM